MYPAIDFMGTTLLLEAVLELAVEGDVPMQQIYC